MRTGLFKKLSLMAVMIAATISTSAFAMKIKKQNLQQLVAASQSIISGQVTNVTDGFDDKNRPYTEVTIRVGQAAKGNHKENSTYIFRQFGLLEPRSMGNGKVYLGVTPEGFAKWHVGEQVVAFMYKAASITGFQTTAGMEQGKFLINNGKVQNSLANNGLFDGMDTSSFSAEEQNLLTTPQAIDASAFMGIVGKLAGVQQ